MNRLVIHIFFILLLSLPCLAERQNSQVGDLEFAAEEKKSDRYQETQDKVLAFAKELVAKTAAPKNITPMPTLSEESLTFLNSAYLLCSVNQGTCPELLDVIYEADLINAKLGSAAICPMTNQFWKLWLKSDMEQRHKYLVKTGFLNSTEEFRRLKRPAYIKCQETIGTIVKGEPTAASVLFEKRYAAGSPIDSSLIHAVKILEEIKKKVPDVYQAVGSRS